MLGMTQMARRGRLQARPSLVNRPAPLGLQSLSDAGLTGGYVYVPASYECGEGAPALLLLQGSGGHAHYGLEMLQQLAEETGLILIAPASCTKQILAQLERMDLDVEYTEFEGGHRIPPQIARHAIEWLTAADESAREPCLSRSAENRPPREG